MAVDFHDKKVVIYGAGKKGIKTLHKLAELGCTPDYFVDRNYGYTIVEDIPDLSGNRVSHSIPVEALEALLKEDTSKLRIIIATDEPRYSEIKNRIKEMSLGDCIISPDLDAEIDNKYKAQYEEFLSNYVPKALPELKLFKPYYPFGETAVIVGLPPERFTGFAKREELKNKELPQYKPLGGACILSTFPARLDSRGTLYTISGNILYNGELLFGVNDIRPDIDIKALRESMGEFELLTVDEEGIELGNDFFGYGKWFYFNADGVFLAATSYHLLLLLLKEAGIRLKLNMEYALANAGCFNWIAKQLFSEEMEVGGIFLVPVDKKLSIDMRGEIVFTNTRIFQERNFPLEYNESEYEELLYRAKDELVQNMRAIFSHPKFKYVLIDLTDGIDTRNVLAAAMNVQFSCRNKMRIRSLDNSTADLKTACAITNALGLSWDNNPRYQENVPITNGLDQSSFSNDLGSYYRTMTPLQTNVMKYPDTIHLAGGGGETCTALLPFTENLVYDPCMSITEYINELTLSKDVLNRSEESCKLLGALIKKEFDKVTSDNPIICEDVFYQKFRNRMHFKCKYGTFKKSAAINSFNPLQSLSAFRAKMMSIHRKLSFQFQHDLIKILHPLLGNFPYIEEKQTRRIKHLVDNNLAYIPFAKLDIIPDYSTESFDKAKLESKSLTTKSKARDSAHREKLREKKSLNDWMNRSDEPLLLCLKAIVDYEPEFLSIAHQYFSFIKRLCLFDDKKNSQTKDILSNKLYHLYYQIKLIE